MQTSGIKENLQKYMPWVILVVFAVFFTLHPLGPTPAHDHFWHLATARDFVKQGLSPFVDHFSYTYSGEPISISVLPYQLGIYAFTEMFGVLRG